MDDNESGVKMSATNARKFYWACKCGKAMGQWTTRTPAQKDYDRHLKEACNERRSD